MASCQVYCRLCAEMKPADKQLDLASDAERLQETINRLVQLKAAVLVDLTAANILPKTICFTCYDMLGRTSHFLHTVASAQKLLQEVFAVYVKQETTYELPVEYLAFEDRCRQDPDDDSDEKLVVRAIERGADSRSSDSELLIDTQRKKKTTGKSEQYDAMRYDVRGTWADYSWRCRQCWVSFPTLSDMRAHAYEHGTCMQFACGDCKRKTYTFDSFITHIRKHRQHLKYLCYICNVKFGESELVTEHMLVHKISNQCVRCGVCFESKEALAEHTEKYTSSCARPRKKKPTEAVTTVSCPECDKPFKTKAYLYEHRKIHTERRRDHACDKCGKAFFNTNTLTQHLQTHTDEKPFKCTICPGSFRTNSKLRRHVYSHSSAKPWCCESCGRGFRTRCHLKAHAIVHTDSTPYSCEYCGKAFKYKTILTQHLRQHTGLKPYSCAHCQRDFFNWANYNKHMKRRHSMDMAKRKRMPDGVFRVNPLTGQVQPVDPDEEKRKIAKQRVTSGRHEALVDNSSVSTDFARVKSDLSPKDCN